MSNPTQSLFPIAKHKVIYAMEAFLEDFKKKKDEQYEECIKAFLTYRSWFKTHTRTREEAIIALQKYMDNNNCLDYCDSVNTYFWNGNSAKYEARQLLKAAKITKEDIVYLSTEDASWVSNWMGENQ